MGKEYVIITYQDYISARTHDNPYGEVPCLKSMITTTGFSVNYVDSATFVIVETGETVRKVL